MSGNDTCFVGQGEDAVVDGPHDLFEVTAGQIGAAYGTGKECVSGDEQFLRSEVKADASRRVARRMQNLRGIVFQADDKLVFSAGIGRSDLGRFNSAEPTGLHLHHVEEGKVILIEENGGSGLSFERERAPHMVDMRVCHHDLLQFQAMLFQARQNLRNIVTGIDDHGFACRFIAKNGAVALQQSDRKCLKDHILIVREAAQNVQNASQ